MSMTSRFKILLASAAGALTLGLATTAAAEPAMWVVKDADSTIYLFGSVHMLPKDMAWETPKIKAALKDATEIWFEIPDPADQQKAVAEVLPTLLTKGLSIDKPLSQRLKPDEFAKVEAGAKAISIDVRVIDVMQPWLAAVILSSAPVMKGGYDPASGVEVVLQKESAAQGDQIKAFESLSQQLSFFSDLSEAIQLDYLRSVLDGGDAKGDLDQMAKAWASADLAALEKGVVGEAKRESPALYDALIVRRNVAWADQIAERLKGSGVSFIAVGAGHLVGPDSVQAQLKKKGIEAKRF